MSKICAYTKTGDLTKIPGIVKTLNKLGIETSSLSNVEVSAAITKLATDRNLTPEDIIKPQYKGIIAAAIASERNRKAKETAELESLTDDKVGTANFILGKKVSKADPRNHRDSLYVYTENLQAYNALADEDSQVTLSSLIEPDEGVKTNVEHTSALMRTDSNGTKNSNVVGLVVKKNAQNKEGKWIKEEGVFQDTDEEFELFSRLNEAATDKIAQAVGIGGDAEYANLSFVKEIALDNAGLPKRFAERLASMLEEKLGITSQVLLSKVGKDLYGLEIQPRAKVKSSSKRNQKEKKLSSAQVARKEAIESLAKERPISEAPDTNPDSRNLLVRLFPDIAERKARVDFISTLFSERLTYYVNMIRNHYNSQADEDLSPEDLAVKDALNRGDESEQRVYTLGIIDSNGTSVANKIVADIKNSLNSFVEAYDQGGSSIDNLVKNELLNENSLFGSEFAIEASQNGWEGQELYKIAKIRISYLADAFRKIIRTPDAFESLLDAASDSLEFNENIRLSANRNRVLETESDTSNTDDEGSAENRSGLNLVKQKLLNPARTLSTKIKNLLGRQYKAEYSVSGGTRYVFNDLGQRVRMDPGVVYYKLLDSFSKMTRPEDFGRILDEVEVNYPWFGEVKQMIQEDEDLRNEFYRAFRRVFVHYSVITSEGKIQFKNSSVSVLAFLDTLTKNYEGRVVLGPNSIYTETGECNTDNVAKLRELLKAPSTKHRKLDDEYYLKDHPLHWAFTVLNRNSKNAKVYTVSNVRKALSLLRGELKGHTRISLEKMLNNLGIDTTNMNLEAILPYIEDEVWEEIESSENPLDTMEEYFTPSQMSKIRNILIAAKNITHEEYGFKKGGNLINDEKSSYLMISNALAMASEAYSMSSFFHDGNQRFSYTAPDYISTMVGSISAVDSDINIENGTRYIEKNFGRYNLFRDPVTGEWMSPWLEDFANNLTVRENFTYTNVLSVGNSSNNSIGKVSDDEFEDGLVSAFFNGNKKDGMEFGYYRNPLFSDTDALVLFKQRRYTGEGYKDAVLDRLVKVFRQEIDRIIAARDNPEGVKVDFYNDGKSNNAAKFCFFTVFRGQEGKIIEDLKQLQENNDSVNYVRARDSYIKGLLSEMMELKFEDWKSGFSEARKLKLFSKILKNLESSSDENADENADEETNTLGKVKDALNRTDSKESKEWKIAQVDDWLEEFFYNDYFAQSQLIQLLFGDLAYAKNIRDFVKRNKQAYASGEKVYARDKEGNPLTETAIYLEDKEAVSNSWTHIKQLLESSPTADIDRALIRGALESFKSITETDGQSFRTLKSFRKIFKAMGGKWNDSMERAYNRIISGEFGAEDFLALWNPIKPFLFSHETKEINGRTEKVTVQHKNSEYLISAVYSMLNTALNRSPELVALHQFMNDHDVDVVHFHSVVKNGCNSPFNLNYDQSAFDEAVKNNGGKFTIGDYSFTASTYKNYKSSLDEALFNGNITQEQYNKGINDFNFKTVDSALKALEAQSKKTVISQAEDLDALSPTYGQTFETEEEVLNEDMFHILPLEDYIVVQPSDDHLIDAVAVFGSQLRNIIPADLSDDFTMKVNIGGETVTLDREGAVKWYNMLIVDQLLDAFSAIDEKFSDIKALKSMLDAAMERNPKYGEDVKAALELNEDGTAFKLPFNSPNLTNKIEDLILSVFKNHIQRQKINGGNVVLVSNFGLSDQLHVKYRNDNPEEGVEYIPAYMPASKRSMYEDYLVEVQEKRPNGETITYWTLDFDKLRDNNEEELLNIVGYRIPTEDKYSCMPIKIVGFLPIVAGTTIMLPSDIITMSGTDFDIDKLFLMIRNTRREIAGKELVDAFKKYTSKNRLDLDIWLNADLKLIDFLSDEKSGYTQDEIAMLIDKSEVFENFMEEEGTAFLYDTPKYTIQKPPVQYDEKGNIDLDATSRMKSIRSRSTRKAIRDNMLIDTIWNVLTSPEGSRLCMTPASYDNVKKASRQQRILHDSNALTKFLEVYKESISKKGLLNTLNSLSIKTMEAFMEENGTPDDPMDIQFYLSTHRNLMDGNDLIGTFAVNSSSHYKFQFANLSLYKDNQFNVTLPGQKTLLVDKVDSQRSPFTGTLIGRTCAEFQAASPDNGKDPVLGDLGANSSTAFRIGFLARIGLDPQTIGILNTAQDLREYGHTVGGADKIDYYNRDIVKILDMLDKTGESKNPSSRDITKMLNKIGKTKKTKNSKNSNKIDWHSYNGDIAKILDMIVELRTTGEIKDPIDREEAAKFSLWMDNIDETARALQKSSCFSRSDSPNGALSVVAAGAIQQLLLVEDFMEEASSPAYPIQGLPDVVDFKLDASSMSEDELRSKIMDKPIPRLQAFYTLGIRSAFTLCKEWLVQTADTVMNAVRKLRDETMDSYTQNLVEKRGIKSMKTFINELTMYLLTTDSVFASDSNSSILDKRNYYIHDFPMKFKNFLEQKDKDGNYIHKDVRDLTIIQMLTNVSKKGIKFLNVGGKVSPTSRKYFMEDLEYMLTHSDPSVQRLAMDLFMYSYYDNGINFGHSNFGIFFTTAFMEQIPKYIDNLVKADGRALSDTQLLERYVEQHLLNHPELMVHPRGYTSSENGEVITMNKKSRNRVLYLKNGIIEAVKYISTVDALGNVKDVYQVVLDSDGYVDIKAPQYRKIDFNRAGTPFYDANTSPEDIPWASLQERGAVASSDISTTSGKSGKPGKSSPTKGSNNDEKAAGSLEKAEEAEAVKDEAISEIAGSLEEDAKALNQDELADRVPDEDEIEERRARKMAAIARLLDEIEEEERKKEPDLIEFKDTEDIDNKVCIPD